MISEVDMKIVSWDNLLMKDSLMIQWWDDLQAAMVKARDAEDWQKVHKLNEEFEVYQAILLDDMVEFDMSENMLN